MQPIATTTKGRVRGISNGPVFAFRGIRYGVSTAGANRFRPPQPTPEWTGTVDAVAPGPSAPQLPKPENVDPFFSWYSAIQPVSEDCLFLNVYTPSLKGKRPVMFWIHGGGWRECSGTAPGFNGSHLAATQDVVVITVNHRLGAFGFLKLEGDDERFADSGNAGLLDIIAALEWVRDNAEAFGGDAGSVTVFGESGGASKTAALMSTSRARGLFHKAVVQSSAGVRLATPEEADRLSHAMAQALGRDGLAPAAMQALPMAQILEAMHSATGPYRGTIDGRTFHGEPFAEARHDRAADIPLLIGCTRTESTYYLRGDPKSFHLELADVRRRLARFLDTDAATVDGLIQHYQEASPGSDPSGLMIAITTDYIFKRPTYTIAKRQAESATAPVHAYLFEWDTPIEGGRMGSPHTVEVPFIFGTLDAARGCIGNGADLAGLSAKMMSIWATFARTGDPNVVGLPHWPTYEGAGQQMMILNVESRCERDPSASARAALEALPMFGGRNVISTLSGD